MYICRTHQELRTADTLFQNELFSILNRMWCWFIRHVFILFPTHKYNLFHPRHMNFHDLQPVPWFFCYSTQLKGLALSRWTYLTDPKSVQQNFIQFQKPHWKFKHPKARQLKIMSDSLHKLPAKLVYVWIDWRRDVQDLLHFYIYSF